MSSYFSRLMGAGQTGRGVGGCRGGRRGAIRAVRPVLSSPLLSSPEGSSVDRQIFSLLIVEKAKERARR